MKQSAAPHRRGIVRPEASESFACLLACQSAKTVFRRLIASLGFKGNRIASTTQSSCIPEHTEFASTFLRKQLRTASSRLVCPLSPYNVRGVTDTILGER